MKIFPLVRETIVSRNTAEDVEKKLWLSTYPVKEGAYMPDKGDNEFLFNGWINNRRFKISRRLKSPENFLPLIKGTVEETSMGSLIFLRYSLFFSSNFFLVFWSVVTLFLSFFFLIFYDKALYALIAIVLGLGNYVIAMANFSMQVKKSSQLLRKTLNNL